MKVKAIIEIDENSDLSSIQFKIGKEVLYWGGLTKEMQTKLLNSIIGHINLFSRFIKTD